MEASGGPRLTDGVVTLRLASAADLPFLAEMTLLAAFPPGPLPDGAREMARVVRWTLDWGRPGDAGVVAWRDGNRVGAAWCQRRRTRRRP